MELPPALMEKIEEVLSANADDLAELMEIAGLGPATDLRGTCLIGVDFGDVDIHGWNFTGTDLRGADMSQVRNIQSAIFHGAVLERTKLPPGMYHVRLGDIHDPSVAPVPTLIFGGGRY